MPPSVPLTGAQTLHPNSVLQAPVEQIEYSEAAKTYINFRRQRLIAARDTRDGVHDEFDGMTFLQWYDKMKKADDQYVAPRKNKQDTSINTGTIRDKDTSLVEYASKYNFEPIAQVYDEDDEAMEELADAGEDLVRKSLLLETFEDKAKLIYRAMVAFGVAMVEDQWVERWTNEKTFGKNTKIGSQSVEWTERLVKQYDGCQAKLWDLRKCYFGDIRKFFLNGPQGQPFFFTVEYESYDQVKQWFGDWERWKFVPNFISYTPEASVPGNYTSSWAMRPITNNYVEIVRYYDPVANEYAITLNGVDMLPIMEKKVTIGGLEKTLVSGFPLTAISPSGAINFAKYDFEPMHDFAYSKGQPSKMRVLADIENMWIKLLIGMMKQKAKPTLGNKSGRNFDDSVTDPGTVINDIREGDLFPVLPNFTGASAQDFSFYELVKKELDKNSVERSFQGIDETQQDETATADMNNMKAQSLKVAAMFDGIISGHKQLFWLRTYNIAKNWTKPIDMEVDTLKKGITMKYRSISMPSEVDGGQKAMKKIVFSKDTPVRPGGKPTLEDSQNVHQQEIDAAKTNGGKEIRITTIHPELFAALRVSWFYDCVPVPNDSDPLSYMMFAKQVQDAIAMFGPESLNVKKLKHRFASISGNDFDTWFLNEQDLAQKQQEAQAAAAATAAPAAPGATSVQQPSIAKAVQGKSPGGRMGVVMK